MADRPPLPEPKDQSRIGLNDIGAIVLAVIGIVFAALNTTEVTINWIFMKTTTPLVIVVLVSGLCGAGITRLILWRRGGKSDN
jgi:uncharacterized integral membrane protein